MFVAEGIGTAGLVAVAAACVGIGARKKRRVTSVIAERFRYMLEEVSELSGEEWGAVERVPGPALRNVRVFTATANTNGLHC